MKSTRTPATRSTKDADPPHRSQMVPTPVSASGARRGQTSQTTMPAPSTTTSQRQRTPSNSQPKPVSSPRPEFPESKSSLDGTGYIVESFPSSTFKSDSREGGVSSSNRLVPPSSMLAPKALSDSTRQSVSSFQTEPSSYYSVEEGGGSSVGPPMPQGPQQTRQNSDPDSPANRYESLWLASHAPPMPTPDLGHPPMPMPDVRPPRMPSPHHHHVNENENDGDFEEYDDDLESSSAGNDFEALNYGTEPPRPSRGSESQSPNVPPKDRYDSSWLAGPSPGMPIPTTGYTSPTANPSMPSPSADLGTRQTQGTARIDYSHTSHGLAVGPRPGAAVGIVSGTAPLRIHHHPRPIGIVTSPSPDDPSNAEPANASASHQNQNQNQPQNQPNPQRVNFHSQQSSGSSYNSTSRPQNERPQTNTPTPPSTQKFGSSYESRPPGASAPSIPSGANASALQNIPAKQHTTQNTAARPGRTQTVVTPSPSSPSPTAPPATAPTSSTSPPPAPSSPSSTPAQHRPPQPSSVGSSYKPAVSSNLAPQKLNTSASPNRTERPSPTITTATTTPRPHVHIEESNRPSTVSSPQIQHQTSSASAANKHQAKVHEASAAVAAGPTRPRLTGNPSQMDTQYVNMLLALDDIPTLYNLLAGFFTWILLAGFILFPGTFSTLQTLNTTGVTGQVQQEFTKAITHLPL